MFVASYWAVLVFNKVTFLGCDMVSFLLWLLLPGANYPKGLKLLSEDMNNFYITTSILYF